MGKRSKRGASLRAKKRADAAHQQLEDLQLKQAEEHRVQSKKDGELFVLDTARKDGLASRKAAATRRKEEKEEGRKRKYEHSELQQRKMKRVLDAHGAEGAIALAARGRARTDGERIRKHITAAAAKPTFDLWGEEGESPAATAKKPKKSAVVDPAFPEPSTPAAPLSNKQRKARRRAAAEAPPKLAVEVAHPGQSYRPDKEQHQDAVGEALAIEIRRNEAEQYRSKPISEGMAAFTKEFIVESSDEESSDEEEDDTAATGPRIVKRKEKLTRAQRNKQKRVKAEETALKERRARKAFLHQANEVRSHSKAVKKAERERRERQTELAQLKAEKKAKPLGKDVWGSLSAKDPIRAPSLPVALTEELKKGEGGGGLRTVAPKGSLVTDRLESMAARKLVTKKRQGGRRIVQGKRRPKKGGGKGTEYLLV
ncbi:hypothetical protein ACHAXT_003200 [Thalassiosira profunda]